LELGHTVLGFCWRLGESDEEVTQSQRRRRMRLGRHGVCGSRVPLRERDRETSEQEVSDFQVVVFQDFWLVGSY
jgi:hypothetical protein